MWIRCRVLHVGSRAMRRGGGGAAAACVLLVLASGAVLGARLDEPLGADNTLPELCPPCPPPPERCKYDGIAQHVCSYKVNNNIDLRINIEVQKTFRLICPDNGMMLNDSSLPRLMKPTNFLTAIFENCPLPNEPYAHVLERLNVSIQELLYLKDVTQGELRADHFVKLETLSKLNITPRNDQTLSVAAPNVTLFTPLTNLMKLKLENVYLPLGMTAIKSLKNLTSLTLFNCALNEINFNQLCDLPVLETLYISDDTLCSTSSEVVCNFTSVTLLTSKLINAPPFPFAKILNIKRRTSLQKIRNCSHLQNLTVTNKKRKIHLLDDWLASCTQLRRLTLTVPWLKGSLTARALPTANSLEALTITGTQLDTLFKGLFDNNTKLRVLTLSKNKLKYIDEGVFSSLSNTLVELDLSNNLLDSNAVTFLDTLQNLKKLKLSNNPLGDLCDHHFFHIASKISNLHMLTHLSLTNTSATTICSNWHKFTRLENLDLDENNITTLEWRDLRNWKQSTEVNLKNNNLNFIAMMPREIYMEAKKTEKISKFKVNFITDDTFLRCDCTLYWFAKALKEDWFPAQFEKLQCEGGTNTLLKETALDEMVCAEKKMCPTNCTCLWRPSNSSVEIDCSSRGLTTFPDMSTIDWANVTVKLQVRNNSISVLPKLPTQLTLLDVRDNALTAADESTVRALWTSERRVLLAGNSLDCNCSQQFLTLPAFTHQIMDLTNTNCSDGRPFLAVLRAGCNPRVVSREALATVGGALLLALAMAVLALRRSVRLRVKAFLLARGYCLNWTRPNDDDHCKYDAFLSYAHEDEAVALQLLGALEGGLGGAGGAPLRLCVHHRDWQPGEWILGQIAKSVRESHRTIILLSENFAKSSWARAEFREAYAHALREDAVRLIVVVLGAAPPAELDDDIRHYVRHNTYVRWGDPTFWEKLRVALPPGRPRARRSRHSAKTKQKPTGVSTAAQPQPAHPNPAQPKSSQPTFTKAKSTQPKPTQPMPAQSAPPTSQPAAPRRPPPLRTDPPAHPAPPRPPTPVVKFGQIDFSAPLKPADAAAPPCA